MITTGTYGEWTRLIPVEQMRDYEFPPEFLPRSPGHYRDWIALAKAASRPVRTSVFRLRLPNGLRLARLRSA